MILSFSLVRACTHTLRTSTGGKDDERSVRVRVQQRYQLPALSTSSLWSNLAAHLHCGEHLPAPSACAWPFHSWFELQRLQFEDRLNKRLFQRLQTRAIRLHPTDPIEQKKELFDALCFSGATNSYATAPKEQNKIKKNALPVDQVLLYRAHLDAQRVRSGDNSISHKDLKLTLREPLWTGNRRLFRKFGSDRFLHVTFDEHLLACSLGGCKVAVSGGAGANLPVGHGCEKCVSLADYLALQLVGKEGDNDSAHVVLALAGTLSTESRQYHNHFSTYHLQYYNNKCTQTPTIGTGIVPPTLMLQTIKFVTCSKYASCMLHPSTRAPVLTVTLTDGLSARIDHMLAMSYLNERSKFIPSP